MNEVGFLLKDRRKKTTKKQFQTNGRLNSHRRKSSWQRSLFITGHVFLSNSICECFHLCMNQDEFKGLFWLLLTRHRSWNWLLDDHRRETIHDATFRSRRSTFLGWPLARRLHSHLNKCHYDWWHDCWSNGYDRIFRPMMKNPTNGHWFWHGSLEYDCYADYSFFVSLCHNNWMTY